MEEQTTPWKTLGSREIYINPWIRVREDQVIRPDEKPGIYGVIEYQNYAIGIVPVAENGDTWLVGQWRYPLDLYSWEIPEGGGPLGAPLIDSAKRELQEEVGLTAGEWVDLGEHHLSNSVSNETGRVYLALDLTEGHSEPEGDEVLQIRRLPLAEAHAMAMDGRITDALSIIGLTRAVHYLAKRSIPPAL
ncbi:MAG: mismatch repair protein MutT [Capsulimonas sp.]|nr:mismatch repair protein MutT [Capsulimonas sp.]